MTEFSANSRRGAWSIEPERIDSPDAQFALGRYVAELERRFPVGFDTSRAAPPAPGDFTPPEGVFLVVRLDVEVVGCGALRRDGGGAGEIRRMWVSPETRGRGIGRALLAALEARAGEMGCERVRLDTAAELSEAKSLYASAGYVEIPAYNDNPYAKHWFEKQLARGRGRVP